MKNSLVSAKNFVVKHKTSILVTSLVVTSTLVVLQNIGVQQHNDFLKEHDLFDAFYALDEV